MAYKRISPQPVAEGGTGATTLTAHGVLLGEGTSAITPTAVGTNGQVLIGASAADPGWVTPAAGTGLSITTNSSTLSYALSTPVSIANGGTNATSMTNTDGVVYYDGTRLVTTAVGSATQVLTSNGAGVAPTFQAAPGGSITITGDSGGGLTGSSFTFTGGTTGLTFAGATSTETLGGTLVVANGGTGDTSLTAYAVLCGGTTSTGAIQSIAGVGTSGQVLTSNGAGALPTFQAAPGGGLLSSTTVLTSSQVKNLHGTPIQAIAAPGANKALWPISIIAKLDYGGSNAFTAGASQFIGLFWAPVSNSNRPFNAITNAAITATSSQYYFGTTLVLTQFTASQIENAALQLYNNNATEISGNAANDNTITVQIIYAIVSI